LVLTVHSAGILTSTRVPSLLRWSLSSSPSLYCTCAIFASTPLLVLPSMRALRTGLRARMLRRAGAASPLSPSSSAMS
jgi:hypothetical protein